MNYLAHLYLAEDTPESLLGNLLGDFLKGSVPDGYSEPIRKGIQLHIKVDRYTDSHEVVRQSKRLISPPNQRYAGIIVDVFYDHFLAKDWANYSAIPLTAFAEKVSEILEAHQNLLPVSLQPLAPSLKTLLISYAEPEGIRTALSRMSARLKRENSLETAGSDLLANYERFQSDFSRFFPDLTEYVRSLRA